MKKTLIILGAGVMQGPALRIAREMGLKTIVIDGSDTAPCINMADRFEQIDLKDKEAIESFALSVQKNENLGGIMTAGTDFSATVAWVAERLGLPGIPYNTALDASDKERMRKRFKLSGVPSPEYLVLQDSVSTPFALPFAYPVVVKPVDNMGSRGCRRADTPSELEQAVEDALHYSRSSRAIVEEYMEGPEFSVDAIVYKGTIHICGLADRHIYYPPYFIEMGHTMPSAVDATISEAVFSVFKRGIRALGIDNGAAKGDIKYTPRGAMIGEIAARLSGGYMSGWTYPYSSGIEPARAAIHVALGEDPGSLEPVKQWTSAERAFISIPGTVHTLHGIEEARKMDAVKDLFLRVEKGSCLQFPVNNVSKCGNIIAAHPDRSKAIKHAEKAAAALLIRLQCPDEATEAFIASYDSEKNRNFPPDAYILPKHIEEALRGFPECLPGTVDAGRVLLRSFPLLEASSVSDYAGRSIQEGLEAVQHILDTRLESTTEIPEDHGLCVLGRGFWKALVRGGYQAAAYYLESFCLNREN